MPPETPFGSMRNCNCDGKPLSNIARSLEATLGGFVTSAKSTVPDWRALALNKLNRPVTLPAAGSSVVAWQSGRRAGRAGAGRVR